MSIIYSYPTFGTANGSDLLLASRFDNEPGGPARTINLSLDTIGSYISTNFTPTLNQVLTEGNTSLLNANINELGLADSFNYNAYGSVTGDKSRINFFGSTTGYLGYVGQNSLGLLDFAGDFTTIIRGADILTASRTVKFQDKDGVVAYLSDIPATTNYGLFAQTANSSPVTATTVESTLINGGVGTLTIPANGFKVGDSFSAVFGGVMNAANNQTIRIRVKAGAITLLDSGVQPLTNSIINDIWSLNIDFTVRQIGGAGVASIVSLGSFHYIKTSNASTQGFAFNVVNNTTFDTTISTDLNVTVQWGSNNVTNNIYSDIFVLNKVY